MQQIPECGFNLRIDNGEISFGRSVGPYSQIADSAAISGGHLAAVSPSAAAPMSLLPDDSRMTVHVVRQSDMAGGGW